MTEQIEEVQTVKYEEENPCFQCKNAREHGGSAHIGCANPPTFYISTDLPYKTRQEAAIKTVEVAQKNDTSLAVIMIWPRCGQFGLHYDGGIVLACSNFKAGQRRRENQFTAMHNAFNQAFGLSEEKDLDGPQRRLIPIYKGELTTKGVEA